MPVTCARCGDVLGVYEPIVVSDAGAARETSRAAEPDAASAGGELYHRDCYAECLAEKGGPAAGAGEGAIVARDAGADADR